MYTHLYIHIYLYMHIHIVIYAAPSHQITCSQALTPAQRHLMLTVRFSYPPAGHKQMNRTSTQSRSFHHREHQEITTTPRLNEQLLVTLSLSGLLHS